VCVEAARAAASAHLASLSYGGSPTATMLGSLQDNEASAKMAVGLVRPTTIGDFEAARATLMAHHDAIEAD
jgi:hypothetical protein